MKNSVRLVVSCCIWSFTCAVAQQPTQSFIIQQPESKKKQSTNELKEKLGEATEGAFDSTTHVTENLGKLQTALADQHKTFGLGVFEVHSALGRVQQTVAHIQRICSSMVKKLIDNEAPFKKARRPVLEKALSTLTLVRTDLSRVVQNLTMWCGKVKGKTLCVAELKTSTLDYEKTVNAAYASIKQDECLKHV